MESHVLFTMAVGLPQGKHFGELREESLGMRTQKQKGFTLIELLIVVGIILVIAAIAVPNLMRARTAGNEASAVGSLRAINTASQAYLSFYPSVGFPPALTNMTDPGTNNAATSTSAGLLDTTVISGNKSGYALTYTAGTAVNGIIPSYTTTANPNTLQQGNRYFCSDNTAVLRYVAGGACTPGTSPVLQ
jgi:type IV pilus assembly protein PilA